MNFYQKKIRNILRLNIQTIRFNFHYFPFKQAIRFPVLISSNTRLLKINGTVVLDSPIYFGKVKFGYGEVGIFDKRFSRSIWEMRGRIEFRGTANIGHGSKISVGKSGELILGDNFTISAESSIIAFKSITIGDNCLIAWNTQIMDTDFHTITDFDKNILNAPASIILGNKIWIGARCMVLKGAEIPSNCVIGAGSIVSGKITVENQLIVGSPAKAVRSGINWEH